MCCNGWCARNRCHIWLFTFGYVLIALGIYLSTGGVVLTRKLVLSKVPLTPGSYAFSKWVVTPLPLYMNFYLYNWTNSDQAGNPDVKPHFQECGPYAFRDVKIKDDIHWNTNGTVTFFDNQTWYFDEEKSNGSLSDIIIGPHFPTVTAAKKARPMGKILRKIVNFAIKTEGGNLTMQHTAIEWIFHGFHDDLFEFAYLLHSPLLSITSPEFAWLYGRNGTAELVGDFTINTGEKDLKQMGDISHWRGKPSTGLWDGECGKVNGSLGELWPIGRPWEQPISIFISDAARFINVFPQKMVQYRGVTGKYYASTEQTFDSGYIAEDTKCFCVKGNECPKNGVIDFSPVAFGGPMYLSHPHFYMTDKLYLENTTGMTPNPEKDRIHMLIEPTFGIPLDMYGQVLISLRVEKDDQIEYLKDLAHDFYAPLFVLQITAEISDEILDFVKLAINIPYIVAYIGIGVLVVGLILLISGIFVHRQQKFLT